MSAMRALHVFAAVGFVIVACTPPAPPEAPGAVAGSPGDGVVTAEPDGGGGAPLASTWKTVDQGVSVPDAWRACAAPADCALVLTTCCDQCNGGKAVAVATSHTKDVEAKFPRQCSQTACTMRGCSTRATCEAGRCVMQWENFGP